MNNLSKFFAVTMFAVCMNGSAVAQTDFCNIRRYAQANKELKEQAKKYSVVFLGNSITEGWYERHPEFFNQNGYVGRGISGQTSSNFLLRFREDVINLAPQVLVLNVGTNDVAENTGPYNEDITFGNIESMVELARAHKIKVVLTSVLPAKGFGWRPEVKDAPEKITALNARIQAYAKKNKITYVDYYTPLLHSDGRALNPAYSKDGVHPTSEGYDVMEGIIVPVLKKMVK